MDQIHIMESTVYDIFTQLHVYIIEVDIFSKFACVVPGMSLNV